MGKSGAAAQRDWRHTIVPVGADAESIDVSPGRRELWTIRPDGTIVIVDITAGTVVATIDSGVQGGHRLKFTSDCEQVIAVSVSTGALIGIDAVSAWPSRRCVAVIDLVSLTERARLPVGGPMA